MHPQRSGQYQRGGHDQRSGIENIDQDLEEHLGSMASRLKLNFRSTSSIGPSFPPFKKQLCRENIPCELQELILTRLPALKLLEMKAVCRSWRDLLQSSSFKEKWKLTRGGGCGEETVDVWVMTSKQEEDMIAYVPQLDKYCLLLLLLYSPVLMAQHAYFPFHPKEASFLCGSGQAVVLGKKDWRSVPSFFIYDLLSGNLLAVNELRLQTGPHGELAIMPSSFPVLIEDKERPPFFTVAIEIQCVNDNRSQPHNQLLVYKFATCTWDFYPQSSAIQDDSSDLSAVLCGELFQYNQEESTLYAWSMQHWSKVAVTFSRAPPRDMMHGEQLVPIHNIEEVKAFKVLKCGGHILLLTVTVEPERGGVAQCVTIWKLMKGAEESDAWNWADISKTPPELCLKSFSQASFSYPTAMCDGSRICILISSHEFSPALVYDVKQGRWYHLHGVLKDMQALFTTKLKIEIEGL